MSYVAWITRNFVSYDMNNHPWNESGIVDFQADTIPDILNQIARHVYYYETHHTEDHKGFEFSRIYHVESDGTRFDMNHLKQTHAWMVLEDQRLKKKAEEEAARLEMLRKSEAHQEALDRANYERLKAKFEGSSQ